MNAARSESTMSERRIARDRKGYIIMHAQKKFACKDTTALNLRSCRNKANGVLRSERVQLKTFLLPRVEMCESHRQLKPTTIYGCNDGTCNYSPK